MSALQRIFLLVSLALGLQLFSVVALAQENPSAASDKTHHLKVGTHVSTPYVFKDDERFRGMAIDLWREVAEDLGHTYELVEYEHLHELLDDTHKGKIDLAVGSLGVTQERAHKVTFTQPWMSSGDRIMIRKRQGHGISVLWHGLKEAGYLRAYGLLVAIIVLITLLFTFFDRKFDPAFPERWRDGLAESFYRTMSIVTSGQPPQLKNLFGWIGRIGQALWLVVGVSIFALITSTVTSVLTSVALSGQIRNLDDLYDKVVGVRAETLQEDNARNRGLRVQTYLHTEDMIQALLDGEIDAIIHNGPALEHHIHKNPKQALQVVGRLFDHEKYAFAMPRGSDLHDPITLEILGLVDDGRVEELKTFYLGSGQ